MFRRREVAATVDEPTTLDETNDADSSTRLYSRLKGVLLPPFHNNGPTEDELQPIVGRLNSLEGEAVRVHRNLLLAEHGHPGSRWNWLLDLIAKSNPEPGSIDDIFSQFEGTHPNYPPVLRFLFDPSSLEQGDYQWLSGFREELADHVRVVGADLDARLA